MRAFDSLIEHCGVSDARGGRHRRTGHCAAISHTAAPRARGTVSPAGANQCRELGACRRHSHQNHTRPVPSSVILAREARGQPLICNTPSQVHERQ
jgi:hypothetical protein